MNSHIQKLPLYDLFNTKHEAPITQAYIDKLTTTLSSLTPDQAQQVALLLIHHYHLTQSYPFDRSTLPYGMKISSSGKGFSFDLSTLPNTFILLLGNYCQITAV